jgi:glycosyltransferase involved in cell wall biosynthesis
MTDKAPINVDICIPSDDDCRMSFAMSLAEMMRYTIAETDKGRLLFHTRIYNARSSNLAGNRNLLVENALEHDADYVLFLDSDMTFPPDTLARLLGSAEQFNLDVIAATYSTRQQGCVCRNNTSRLDSGIYRKIQTAAMNGIFEINNVGTGIMLIAARVFRNLAKPWFMFTWNEATQELEGEDTSFCKKANAAGFKIWVDYDLSKQTGHIGTFTYTVNETADIACIREVTTVNREAEGTNATEISALRGDSVRM